MSAPWQDNKRKALPASNALLILFGHLFYSPIYTLGIVTALGVELCGSAVLDELIGDTEASHLLDVAVLDEPILDCTACATANDTIFDRNHSLETLGNLGK